MYHKIKCDDYKIDIAAHFSELFSSNGSAFISQQGSSSWNVFYWLYQHPVSSQSSSSCELADMLLDLFWQNFKL